MERLFSKAIRVLGDKCRKSADIRRAMMLSSTVALLGLSGYGLPATPVAPKPSLDAGGELPNAGGACADDDCMEPSDESAQVHSVVFSEAQVAQDA